jgi:hypothetical protein
VSSVTQLVRETSGPISNYFIYKPVIFKAGPDQRRTGMEYNIAFDVHDIIKPCAADPLVLQTIHGAPVAIDIPLYGRHIFTDR